MRSKQNEMKEKDDISQHSLTNKNRIKMLPESEGTQLTLQYRQIIFQTNSENVSNI